MQIIEKRALQTEMHVTGQIFTDTTENWLRTRLKSVSTEDMQKELTKVRDDQSKQINFFFHFRLTSLIIYSLFLFLTAKIKRSFKTGIFQSKTQ